MITDKDNNILFGAYMHLISRKMYLLVDELLVNEKVTHQQGKILCYIKENSENGCVPQYVLEEVFNLRRSSITSVLTNLEKKNLIKRESHELDKRVKNIYLTEDALVLLPQIKVHMRAVEQQLIKGMSEEEKLLFAEFLQRGLKNLRDLQ